MRKKRDQFMRESKESKKRLRVFVKLNQSTFTVPKSDAKKISNANVTATMGEPQCKAPI